MRIGIDIDGVLTDIEKWQLDYGSKFYYENYKMEIQNYNAYETNDIFNVSQKLDDEFWKKYFIDYSKNVEPRKFADEVTRKLKEDGNEIYIITARGSFLSHSKTAMLYEENKRIVLKWLKENNISFDKIIFSPEDKLEICMENNIDVMIEDKVDNIDKISSKIPVICMNASYNEKCNGAKIIRCYSWYDIYAKINNLKNSN